MVVGTHTYHSYIYIYVCVVYRWYIEVANGVYKPTYNCGGHHLVKSCRKFGSAWNNGWLVLPDCNRCQGVRHQAPEAGRRDWNQAFIERSWGRTLGGYDLLLHVVHMEAQAVPSSLDGELPWCTGTSPAKPTSCTRRRGGGSHGSQTGQTSKQQPLAPPPPP